MRDDYSFDIVNFPFLDSNIPSGPAYGVYISQLIRYACACYSYDDFCDRHRVLFIRLTSQGYNVKKLRRCFIKFCKDYEAVIHKYGRSIEVMFDDVFIVDEFVFGYWLVQKLKNE